MFSFFNKKQKPNWSPFENASIHNKFESLVSNYFKSKGIEHTIENGIVNVPNNEFGFNNLGLQNIAQFCNNEGENKFKEHIQGHFETLKRGYEFNKNFELLKTDYNLVKEYLGIRLYHNSYIKNLDKVQTIGKNIAGDIYAMLIFDLPETVISVSPDETNKWNKSDDELWKESLKNIISKYPPTITSKELQGIPFKTIEDDHFYSPNIIFNIDSHQELIGEFGSLISMPTRHIVIVYPINNAQAINAINTQLQVTYGVSSKGPGTLSNNLFWIKNGKIENQPYKITDGRLSFTPSEEFVNMLNKLK